MVRIISDTSTLYSTTEARQAGFAVSPLSVTIAGNSYREFDEISADAFVALIREGHMPSSSQPAVGDVAALYEAYPEDEILNIAMADGLSGTYASAVAAAGLCEGRPGLSCGAGHPGRRQLTYIAAVCDFADGGFLKVLQRKRQDCLQGGPVFVILG